jgi:2-desacetyl-2-hydroxyethyl bacteriochlorophyllide A dehydrogenase
MSDSVHGERSSLFFVGPKEVKTRSEPIPSPERGEVLVRTIISAVSAGTEMLFYRNQVDEGIKLDSALAELGAPFHYPFKYGYALVGSIEKRGKGVPKEWQGRMVFCFHPHESHFVSSLADVIPVPKGMKAEDAVFLPLMEAALCFAMDGRPVVGEKVVVLGQGVIGLLTTAILSRFPLSRLVTVDAIQTRRQKSLVMGADRSFDSSTTPAELLKQSDMDDSKVDLVFEVSGDPQAIDFALSIAGFDARIVLGSWYGNKPSVVHLGREFHRNRVHMISSQVSSVAPSLQGRWTKARRIEFTWKLLDKIRPSKLITHRYRLEDAASAYQLIDNRSEEVGQLVFVYDERK